jgi:hypothetical protein
MTTNINYINDGKRRRVVNQRIDSGAKKGKDVKLLAPPKGMEKPAKSKMRKLNAAELFGMRSRVAWNLIAEEEPGSGNCAVPLALLALARWDVVGDTWLTFLAQVYGAEILDIVEEWVRSGSVEKSTNAEGTWYRLAIFPKGYEKLLTLIANEEPGMYRRALDRTQGAMKGKHSMAEVVEQAATNRWRQPGSRNRWTKEELEQAIFKKKLPTLDRAITGKHHGQT